MYSFSTFKIKKCAFLEILSMLQSIQQQFPGIYKLWMGPDLYFMISDPKYIEIILNSPRAIEKQFYIYEPFAEILGDGLLTTNGKYHSSTKKWD